MSSIRSRNRLAVADRPSVSGKSFEPFASLLRTVDDRLVNDGVSTALSIGSQEHGYAIWYAQYRCRFSCKVKMNPRRILRRPGFKTGIGGGEKARKKNCGEGLEHRERKRQQERSICKSLWSRRRFACPAVWDRGRWLPEG